MCGLYRYGGSRTHVPSRNRATADPTGFVPGGAARGPRRGGARRETGEPRLRRPPCLAPARPRDVACKTMRTAPEASRPRRPVHGRRSRVRGTEPAFGAPRTSITPFVRPEVSMSTACFRAAACIVPFSRVSAGFGTLCGGARPATPSWRRARGAAQWPPNRCSAVLHPRVVGPLPVTDVAPPWSLAPLVRFGSGSPAGGALPRSRAESVESEHAAPGPLV